MWSRYLMAPLPYIEQVSYGPPHICMVPPICTIWVLWFPIPYMEYVSYGHPLPHMEQVSYGSPTSTYGPCHMWSVFMSDMTLMAPYLIWNRYLMVPLPYMEQVSYGPHMYVWSCLCKVSSCLICLLWPHTLYGIGILWSPLPYMDQVLYGPPHVHMVPCHVKCLHVLYDSYGPPYLIWNRYHIVPPHVCMVSPHVKYDFFRSPIPYME